MNEHSDEINEVKRSIDRERANLLTVIAALSFLCICLFLSDISLAAFSVSTINERDAVSVALDDQRLQYYKCIRDEVYTADCGQEMVSPPSRDIRRDLESSGFAEVLYSDGLRGGVEDIGPDGRRPTEAFGLLGRIIY